MRSIIVQAIAVVAAAFAIPQAYALTGGGTAPGGPLSGSIRPACNGFNMDGTINTSPGAGRPGCVDRSARAIRRPAAEPRSRN